MDAKIADEYTTVRDRGADGQKSPIPIFINIAIDYAFRDILVFHEVSYFIIQKENR